MKNKYNWKALGLMILFIVIGMLIVFIWHVDQVKYGEFTLFVLDDGNLILKIWKGFVALSWITFGVAFVVFLFREFPIKPGRYEGVTVKVGDTFIVDDQSEHPYKSYRLAITRIDAEMRALHLDKSAETSGKFIFCIRNENQSV